MTSLDAIVLAVRERLPAGVSEDELAGFVHRHRPELERLLAAAGFVQRLRVSWYASGTNHPGEVRGWASIGAPIGVSVGELERPGMMLALEALAGSSVRVFVDSGAFSETEETPITPAGWRWRMEVYARLGRVLGPQLALVAPDRVGAPEESARRLRRWAPDDTVPTQARGAVPQPHVGETAATVGLRYAPAIPALAMARASAPRQICGAGGPGQQ